MALFHPYFEFQAVLCREYKKGHCLLWQERTFTRKKLESLVSPGECFIAADGPLAPGNFVGPHPPKAF